MNGGRRRCRLPKFPALVRVMVAALLLSVAACSTVTGSAGTPTPAPTAAPPPAAGTPPATDSSATDSPATDSSAAGSSALGSLPSSPAADTSSADPAAVTTNAATSTVATNAATAVTPTAAGTTSKRDTAASTSGTAGRTTGGTTDPATQVIELSPLASGGSLKGGFTEEVQGEPISGCAISPVSRTAGVYQCGPSALYAPACWPKGSGQLYCMSTPDQKKVRVFELTEPLPTDPPSNQPLPWALKLANGAFCSIRIGGAWGGRADGYAGAYSCVGGHSGDVVLVASTEHTPVDARQPLWTVPYGPLGPNGTETFPAPQRIAVTTAWFAVNRTSSTPSSTAPSTAPSTAAAGGTQGTPVDPAGYGSGSLHDFKSPSGNVYCQLTDTVRCAIFSYDFTAPTPASTPSFCSAASAAAINQLVIDADGRAGTACNGDPGEVHPKVLPYGSSLTVGQFRCVSQTSGVECRSTASGHGFSVSRAAAAFF